MKNIFLLLACVHVFDFVYGQECVNGLSPSDSIFGLYPDSSITVSCTPDQPIRTIVVSKIDSITDNAGTVWLYYDAMRIQYCQGLPDGFDLVTLDIDSLEQYGPFGIWQDSTPSIMGNILSGCFSFSASPEAKIAASFGGINGQGIYELQFVLEYRLDSMSEDLTWLGFEEGHWTSTMDFWPLYGTDTILFTIQVLPLDCPTDMIAVASTQCNIESMPSCNGSANVQVYFGTPPYIFDFSSGQSGNASSVDSLCIGLYEVTVTDALGSVYVTQFVISSSENLLFNPPGLLDSLILPDVTLNYSEPSEWCELDFSSAVDSFEVTNTQVYDGGIVLSQPIDVFQIAVSDSAVVTWLLFQNGQSFDTSVTYYGIETLDCIFELTVFCLDGRAEFGSFQMYASADMNALVGVNSFASHPLALHPNPTNSILRFNASASSPYTVTDMVGRTVQQGMAQQGPNEVQVAALPNGIYLIRLEGTGAAARFVKGGE
jgi:hypothetical protein